MTTMKTTTDSDSVMLLLKESTAAQHDAAENHAFQRALVEGRLSREAYAANLAQLFLVHRALERRLRESADALPAIGAVVTEEQYQEPYLREDLAFFGIDPESIEALEATRSLVARIEGASPVELLGMHYVLEGSNNGGRFIAKKVRKAYDFEEDAPGTRYLDPYGDEQRGKWMAFKATMDEQAFTPEQREQMVTAAQGMFDSLAAIGGDLAARHGVGADN